MKYDYLIVGGGYAGIFFAHQLIKHNKSFLLITDGKRSASEVSAGIVNPVVLKRFTTFWLALEQIDSLKLSLFEIESYTGKNYLIDESIFRIFHDDKEKKLWIDKSNNEDLAPFLSKEFYELDVVNNPNDCGRVYHSCRLNVSEFFEGMYSYLRRTKHLKREKFNFEKLDAEAKTYNGVEYTNIVFAEGIAVRHNPFFSELPVHPNKGHHLTVRLDKPLVDQYSLKKKHFLFPLSNGKYYYGGTYDREDLTEEVKEKSKEQLVTGLQEIYPHNFHVRNVNYGFRPTVKDRRPILGAHPEVGGMFVFNGLGARGILNGNFFAKELFDFIEKGVPLREEVDLKRFS